MSLEKISDESVINYYESIRKQADADRTHKHHFTASPSVRVRAEKLREEMSGDACSIRLSTGLLSCDPCRLGAEGEEMTDNDPNQPLTKVDGGLDTDATSAGYDNYRSLRDPNILIFVVHDAVPPFRFQAGGWELLQSSIELGPAMKARIADKGFFMFRVNEDRTSGVERSDPQTPLLEQG